MTQRVKKKKNKNKRKTVRRGAGSQCEQSGYQILQLISTYKMSCFMRISVVWLTDQVIHKLDLLANEYELQRKNTGLRGFRLGPTQTGLCSYRRWLEPCNLGFRKKMGCTIRVSKTKVLISFAVTAKLICAFVFA